MGHRQELHSVVLEGDGSVEAKVAARRVLFAESPRLEELDEQRLQERVR